MNVEIEVRNRLVADAALDALVEGRVYQLMLPQKVRLPAIRVQLIDEPTTSHLRGTRKLRRARVQVDAFADPSSADPYLTVTEIADACDVALFGSWSMGSPVQRIINFAERIDRRPMYEAEELRVTRMSSDYFVWSTAA